MVQNAFLGLGYWEEARDRTYEAKGQQACCVTSTGSWCSVCTKVPNVHSLLLGMEGRSSGLIATPE